MKHVNEKQRLSSTPQIYESISIHPFNYPTGLKTNHRSSSTNNLTTTTTSAITMKCSNENIVSQSSNSSSTTNINETIRIGEILYSYLPYMADVYFQYCNDRSQANKYLQAKVDFNEPFRSYVTMFQNKTNGLSVNGFLTKPIQRVTRYPLLIEKILKYTSIHHPDYQSIKKALECAHQLNQRINKQLYEQENHIRLEWLQQHFIFKNSEENSSSNGCIFDELLIFNSLTKFQIQRQLLLHDLLMKVSRKLKH